ncbi:flavin reductase family protein [Hoeflea sp. WL0058]|uniref:Flavin reductase family protein n=1 Tax=Flavimaribacter sediminis TaxID=2865987 RepID=A0AAE3CZT2_9HYPH|nr:flavin reductase family protein [Flavimaribacter sediminis]MBW8636999.1 flavin reductase family protein [Flavimaribacter sediminis]
MRDKRGLRNALGKFATGVAVATTVTQDGKPVGVTINSFTSVSLEPALVLWSLTRNSPNLRHFTGHGWFGINILSASQSEVSRVFASPTPDRFEKIDWRYGIHGVPVLDGTLARFECEVERVADGGDHLVFFGHVHAHNEEEREPLLFFSGQYGTANIAS